jgi:hypothetical protein
MLLAIMPSKRIAAATYLINVAKLMEACTVIAKQKR